MGKFTIYFNVIILILLLSLNISIVYSFFFLDKEKRFEIAENNQGTYFSDCMFNILNIQFPEFSKAYRERSVAYNKRGKYEEGFFYLNKAVSIDPVENLGYRGWIKYEYLRDYEGAINDFKRLDSLTPNFVDYPWGVNIYQMLGNSYAAKKDYKLALLEYEKYLISTNEKDYTGDFFIFYGKSLENNNNLQEALKSYSRAIVIDSLRADHHYYKATILFKLKKFSEAKIYIKNAQNLYEKNYTYKDKYNDLYMQINKNQIMLYTVH